MKALRAVDKKIRDRELSGDKAEFLTFRLKVSHFLEENIAKTSQTYFDIRFSVFEKPKPLKQTQGPDILHASTGFRYAWNGLYLIWPTLIKPFSLEEAEEEDEEEEEEEEAGDDDDNYDGDDDKEEKEEKRIK
ncbi:Hypothetical predicted protein [Octopus vulgaris]|uniref:Uncharacterized protein n=1 Tax=Octopus vulgaris TaxID=6645 RepID=A0AA36BS30_OCTVU|nr:Hypothetical predicted protein [Octopus vulgaris]